MDLRRESTGWQYEHLKVTLDDESLAEDLHVVVEVNAQARISEEVAAQLSTGVLTALLKPNGKVRGIVAEETFRRLIDRTLAKQYEEDLEEGCAPHQYAEHQGRYRMRSARSTSCNRRRRRP